MEREGSEGKHRLAPGPRGLRLFGLLRRVWFDPLQLLIDIAHKYGDVVYLGGFGRRRLYFVNHPSYIEQILLDNGRHYHKGMMYESVKPLVGQGILTSEGEFWRRQRRLIQPAFHRDNLATLAPIITDSTAEMLPRWRIIAEGGEPFDVVKEMARLTQKIIVKTMFGSDFSQEAETLETALATALAYLIGH